MNCSAIKKDGNPCTLKSFQDGMCKRHYNLKNKNTGLTKKTSKKSEKKKKKELVLQKEIVPDVIRWLQNNQKEIRMVSSYQDGYKDSIGRVYNKDFDMIGVLCDGEVKDMFFGDRRIGVSGARTSDENTQNTKIYESVPVVVPERKKEELSDSDYVDVTEDEDGNFVDTYGNVYDLKEHMIVAKKIEGEVFQLKDPIDPSMDDTKNQEKIQSVHGLTFIEDGEEFELEVE